MLQRTLCTAAIVAGFASASAAANDESFVGVWRGVSGVDIYTKLVIASETDSGVTYCYVQGCRQQECSDWAVTGSTDATFAYENALGRWEFERVSHEQIDGRFTNAAGGVSRVTYWPE